MQLLIILVIEESLFMWLSRMKDCLSSTLVSLIWTMTGKEDLQLQLLDPILICLFKAEPRVL